MKIQELRLKLYVKDFLVERHFYEEVLCFAIQRSWDRGADDRGVMFDTGSGIIELLPAGDNYLPPQGCDVSLGVEDVWSLWQSLQNNASIVHKLRDNSWGDTSFCISDPEGFNLTFFSQTPTHKADSSS
jgi:hypothetical protein